MGREIVPKPLTTDALISYTRSLLLTKAGGFFSAGEITKKLTALGYDVRRASVKRACELLLAQKEVQAETRTFWRNEREVRGRAYGVVVVKDPENPFSRFDGPSVDDVATEIRGGGKK